jgi:hypothetical protein
MLNNKDNDCELGRNQSDELKRPPVPGGLDNEVWPTPEFVSLPKSIPCGAQVGFMKMVRQHRVIPAATVQEGHTHGEQRVYDTLWRLAKSTGGGLGGHPKPAIEGHFKTGQR